MPRTVTVNDKMQHGYRYQRVAPAGRSFDPEFKPELTPAEMLKLGVFGVLLSVPVTYLMGELATYLGVKPQLSLELMGAAAVVTLVMAILSGIVALRSLKQIEPVNLLR